MFTEIVAFLLVLLCFSLFVIRPRPDVSKSGDPAGSFLPPRRLLGPHPLIILICFSQSFVVSQAAIEAVEMIRTIGYDHGIPNTALALTVVLAGLLKAGSAALWFSTAAGLWQSRSWAYYVAVVLNLLTLSLSVPARFETASYFVFAPRALITLVLLLVRPIREQFRRVKTPLQQGAVP